MFIVQNINISGKENVDVTQCYIACIFYNTLTSRIIIIEYVIPKHGVRRKQNCKYESKYYAVAIY